MPQEEVIARAQEDKEQGKLPSTQAGGFVREEMHHIGEGKHGARSPQQAIAIGLSKARRAGVKLPPPKSTRVAQRDLQKGKTPAGSPSKVHWRAVLVRCAQTGRAIRSITCESLEACTAAARTRGGRARHRAAMKVVQTKGREGLSERRALVALLRSGGKSGGPKNCETG